MVEGGRLGGTCVNVGCVPKKLMWNAAHLGQALYDARDYGFDITVPRPDAWHDWATLKAKRDAYVTKLNGIYERNLEKSKVTLVRGLARLLGAGRVEVEGRVITAEHVLLATGGAPHRPRIPGCDLGIDSDGFFELPERPKRVAVAGGGYIGVELAGIFAGLGSEVTLLLRSDGVLRGFDPMLREGAVAALKEHGVDVRFNASAHALSQGRTAGSSRICPTGSRPDRSIATCGPPVAGRARR